MAESTPTIQKALITTIALRTREFHFPTIEFPSLNAASSPKFQPLLDVTFYSVRYQLASSTITIRLGSFKRRPDAVSPSGGELLDNLRRSFCQRFNPSGGAGNSTENRTVNKLWCDRPTERPERR